MKSSLRLALCLVSLSYGAVFTACSDDDDNAANATGGSSGPGELAGSGGSGGLNGSSAVDGTVQCQVIGTLCHEGDTGSGAAHDCHEEGHEGVATACAKDFSSCIFSCVTDSDDIGSGGSASRPDALCVALGELCHEVDDVDGPLHDCHEVGHEGVAAACAEQFDNCATECLAARAKLEASGEGGAPASGGAAAGGATRGGAGGAG